VGPGAGARDYLTAVQICSLFNGWLIDRPVSAQLGLNSTKSSLSRNGSDPAEFR
jgi:hypothetical protein